MIENGYKEAARNRWLRDGSPAQVGKSSGRLVCVDGKTIRGSGNEQHKAYHVVSAWVGQQGITLGELQVGEKTNEMNPDVMAKILSKK